ncbi:MAG TPA: S9 family peptidase [Gemmatimonadales bacterium]|nr:S9 family peptidase [Gemmatimonadales bacterium]
MEFPYRPAVSLAAAVLAAAPLPARQSPAPPDRFTMRDVFDLEWAADPQISPDGKRIVFARSGYDIMKDDQRSTLWIVNADGADLRPLLASGRDARAPRWSPDGTKLLYLSSTDGHSELFVRWMDTGQETNLTRLAESPGGMAWSPDGSWIAFTMFVPDPPRPLAELPTAPPGANWGPAIKFIEGVNYRADGAGYLPTGHRHIFLLPAEGGTPRALTGGPYDDGAPRWAPDGRALIFSADRSANADYNAVESEVYEVAVADGSVKTLTHRKGPDASPAISPDGRLIAYTGFDDRDQWYQVSHLYVMNRDGTGSRLLTGGLDRDIAEPVWSKDGLGLYVQYDDQADTRIAYVPLTGAMRPVAQGLGGLSLDRPYSGGSYSVSADGKLAFTLGGPDHLADLAVARAGTAPQRLTRLNDDLLGRKKLGTVEEIWYQSGFDQRRIQGWIVKPPGFDPAKKYPLILEIHGGPSAMYGPFFGADIQLYSAAGYVILYTNPRGSTGYGEEFGNLIHHDYPHHDYDDLMTGVDSVIGRGYVSPDSLYVTGGSGGGVLTAWIVGHTHRFKAAVVSKPVINWTSFVLTSDGLSLYTRYWFSGPPWQHPEEYARRSPLTYVDSVTTPTMLFTGEVDWRTPSSEAEQFYGALKLRKVPTAMLRIPDASHGVEEHPSNLIAKAAYIIGWFNRYRS